MKSFKDRTVCCCKYHVQLIKLKDAFNRMQASKLLHSPKCGHECQVCNCDEVAARTFVANWIIYVGITMLWQACLYSKPKNAKFIRHECILGACL